MKTTLSNVLTFTGSVVVGCGAAIAIASAAAVSQAAPSLRQMPTAAPVSVVRLEPVTVTVSKAYYDAVRDAARSDASNLARASDSRKVTRG